MPRIGRGTPTSSPSPEHTSRATTPSSPETGAGSAAGRRERHGFLGFLARPFRGSSSSARTPGNAGAGSASEREQAPASRAAPRTASALLERTPALARGRGEEVMARLTRTPAQSPGRTSYGAPAGSAARGAAAAQPGRRHAPEAQAATIVQQLRDAGVDLADVRGNVAAAMQGDPVGFNVRAVSVLQRHFPRMSELGLAGNEPLAEALLQTLPHAAPAAAPRARLAPARPQPGPTGGAVRNALSPSSAGQTSARVPRGQASGANTNTPLLGRLTGSGIDIGRLAEAIDQTVRNGHDLPADIGHALRRAGVEPHVDGRADRVSHALLQLRREIYQATGGGGDASPPREAPRAPRISRRALAGIPAIGASRLHRADAQAARARLTIPDRAAGENNAQYAWRVRRQNPGASVAEIAAAAVGPSGHLNLQSTISELNALIKTHEKIRAAFSSLRTIPKGDAEHMGFKDGETDCLFGEELSLSNSSQRVIGLAQQPSNPSRSGYDTATNKDVVFMDLNKLAEYLTTKPRHPMNNHPLDAKNIRDFAFRIA